MSGYFFKKIGFDIERYGCLFECVGVSFGNADNDYATKELLLSGFLYVAHKAKPKTIDFEMVVQMHLFLFAFKQFVAMLTYASHDIINGIKATRF